MTTRNDRRSPQVLNDLVNRQVKVTLTSWEKRNIKELLFELTGVTFKKQEEGCGSCWRRAIETICKVQKSRGQVEKVDNYNPNKPILVKDKMVVNEKPEEVETPDYDSMKWKDLIKILPDGYKGSRKKEDIITYLKSK